MLSRCAARGSLFLKPNRTRLIGPARHSLFASTLTTCFWTRGIVDTSQLLFNVAPVSRWTAVVTKVWASCIYRTESRGLATILNVQSVALLFVSKFQVGDMYRKECSRAKPVWNIRRFRHMYIRMSQFQMWGGGNYTRLWTRGVVNTWKRIQSKSRVFTEDKVGEVVSGLNIILENHLDALDWRPGFKISLLKFALFRTGTFNAWS
jgi:hypothetical protein